MDTTYRKGDRVQVTGKGRTANWARGLLGTVESTRQDRVYVQWDVAPTLIDEMDLDEVKKVAHVS